MDLIKEVYLEKWEDYADHFGNFNCEEKRYIFRGHSNTVTEKGEFQKWKLISSFNRTHEKRGCYSFTQYLYQHFEDDLFKIYYGQYNYDKIKPLAEISLLQKCYFFQHYGIPTCFMDFTFDPLIALYFSLNSIDGRSGGAFDEQGNPLFYANGPERDYVSIYQVDVIRLRELIPIKHVDHETFGIIHHDEYQVPLRTYGDPIVYLGLDLDPTGGQGHFPEDYNYNLKKQQGCFLYYDNEEFKQPFEEFVDTYCKINDVQAKEIVVTAFNINYNSLFKKMHSRNPDHVPLFRFLKNRQLTGQYLFNDIQGLKYDFNFFHQQ